jgi:hypothetical protein
MVQHGIPQIHLEAGARIFARHLVKNDQNPVFQACPEPTYESLPHLNAPDEGNCWRLFAVMVA